MERTIWSYKAASLRNPAEVIETQVKVTGKLFNDLQMISALFNGSLHPTFRDAGHLEAEVPHFSAISVKFDLFSFKILAIALSGCPTRMVKFNNCELTAEHIDMLAVSLLSENFPWLQIDWNPLAEHKFAELVREGSKLQLLSLRASNISDEGFRLICENLKNNKYLRTLDVYGNFVSCLTPLAEVLDVNRFLINVNLGKNFITDESLAPLVGVFGKLEFPEDKVEEYRKKEKELAKIKAQKNRGKVVEPEAPADELIQDEESKQFFLLKNKTFKHLNLSFCPLTRCENLRIILDHALSTFKAVISFNQIPSDVLEMMQKQYSNNLVL
jgi:hypothetical protein